MRTAILLAAGAALVVTASPAEAAKFRSCDTPKSLRMNYGGLKMSAPSRSALDCGLARYTQRLELRSLAGSSDRPRLRNGFECSVQGFPQYDSSRIDCWRRHSHIWFFTFA